MWSENFRNVEVRKLHSLHWSYEIGFQVSLAEFYKHFAPVGGVCKMFSDAVGNGYITWIDNHFDFAFNYIQSHLSAVFSGTSSGQIVP